MSQKSHWEKVYSSKSTDRLGWFAPRLESSLAWIHGLELAVDAPVIDIGGGASTLVDDLIAAGHDSVTVLDISEHALAAARSRLGEKASVVTWLVADVTSIDLPADQFSLWHDRAVFHFLTEPGQRRKYRDNLVTALKPQGHVVIGTFAPEAPPKCSGLPVERYTREQLAEFFGSEFRLIDDHKQLHITPGGVEQMYQYCLFRRSSDDNG